MAKKSKKTEGMKIAIESPMYTDRCIVIDGNGMPWVIDPAKGTVSPANIQMPAVEKRK